MYPGRVRGWFIFCGPCLAFRVPSAWVKPRGNFEVTQMDSVDQTQESYIVNIPSTRTQNCPAEHQSEEPCFSFWNLSTKSLAAATPAERWPWEALKSKSIHPFPFLYPRPIPVFSSHASHLKQVKTITNWKSYATERCSWWEANASGPGFPKISQNHCLTGGSLARTHGSLRYRTMFSDLCVRETGGL